MTQEEIKALLSRVPNSTELKELARKLLKDHKKKIRSPVFMLAFNNSINCNREYINNHRPPLFPIGNRDECFAFVVMP